jgi:hypothetical protein
MPPAAALRSIISHQGPLGSETAPSWTVRRDDSDGQPGQRAPCPGCERVRRAAIAFLTGGPRQHGTLATARQQAEREGTQALTALEALSQELQVAMRRAEPPERVNHLRKQLTACLVRVQALHRCARAAPD